MIKINGVEILTVLDGLTWEGSKKSAVRTLNFQFLYRPINEDIPRYKVKCGDKVEYTDTVKENDNEVIKTLFFGYIEKIDYTTTGDTITITCIDFMSHLKRSKCIGRFRGTLNQIANNICGSFGLINGINAAESTIHNIISEGTKTYYDVLFEVCQVMYENFNLYLDGTTLKLAEHTSQATFKIGYNIRSSSFSQDISNIVNKVLIIDSEGRLIKPVEDNELLNEFGLFQGVYNYNKDTKNNIAEAKKQLKKTENKASIVCNNDNNCISGRYIKVLEPVTGQMGFFEIQSDSHTIGADSYMELVIKLISETNETEGINEL